MNAIHAQKLAKFWLIIWFGSALLVHFFPDKLFLPVLSNSLRSPAWSHWMGYDSYGRDLQFSVLKASLRSTAFASLAVSLSCILGLFLGATIAQSPARIRFVALRALDTLLSFPSLLIALALAAVRGPGWGTLMASLLIGILPPFTRLMYARSREILSQPFIEAAETLGAGRFHVIRRHLIPMLGSTCAVKIPLLFAQALTAEATLSFLGVGAPAGSDTWGSLLAAGKEYLFEAPHIAFAAGVPLTLTILSFQWISEGVSESKMR